MHTTASRIWATLLALVTASAWCAARADTSFDIQPTAEEQRGRDWPSYGRTYSEQFYSPLTAIDSDNVSQLGLAWYLDLPGERTLEATPLAVNGVLYFSGTYGTAYAVDARSGRQLWKFDPEPGRHRPQIFRFSGSVGGHRGVAYWHGRIYVGVIDGRLFALNAQSGKVLWSVATFDPRGRQTISGAPRVFNGKVIIGHNGDPGSRGYVTAYDAETGRQRWRFYTVPGEPSKGFENAAMAMAAKTWSGQWWKSGGNGSVWDSVVYDPEFNRVYLGTANWIPGGEGDKGSPKGDHLFVSSIVAVDADSGHYLWHYQENPRGELDYDSTNPMVLAELTISGTLRKVIMQAPKNGFFYVIDRANGRLISAEKYSKVTWADRVDMKSGRPVELPGGRDVWPSFLGAHSWQPMAFNPTTGLVYLPTMTLGMRLDPFEFTATDLDDGTATLLAWDPAAKKTRWEVRYKDSFWNGGTLTTAGNLVFQGTARGDLLAYNASTGAKLWGFHAGLGIIGTPMSYGVDGTQYVSVLVGYGGVSSLFGKRFDYGWRFNEQPRRLLTFVLRGHTPLMPGASPRFTVKAVDDPTLTIDSGMAITGSELYRKASCMVCHGPKLENSGSFAPDLRESTLAMDWYAFQSVVHDGALAAAGMPKFDELSKEELRDIFMYVRQRAREATLSTH